MKYLIGEILTEHIKAQNIPFRRYAIDCDTTPNSLNQFRLGHAPAAKKRLEKLIDVELLREPLLEVIKQELDNDNIDIGLIIDIYNAIYTNKKRGDK